MTNLGMDAKQAQQATELSSKIIRVYDLLADQALEIPQYQRPYKWTGKHINQLFSDIAIHKDKSAYRLGTIVFHREGEKEYRRWPAAHHQPAAGGPCADSAVQGESA